MSPFRLLRLLDDQHFTPGPQLAAQTGVSRATISLTLRDAARLGIPVESIRGRGYRLARPISWLDEPTVAAHLGPAARYFDLKIFDQIPSTNTALLQAAQEGAPSGMVYAAEFQSAGRGRLGRRWIGSMGDTLMASLLWRFELGVADLAGLSLVVGIAVMRTLAALGLPQTGPTRIGLKWPNDILLLDNDQRAGKLGGVLVELTGDTLGPSVVVMGLGLNLRWQTPVDEAPPEQAVATLAQLGCTVDRNHLLASLLQSLAELLPAFEQQGFAPLRSEWERYHGYQGQTVQLIHPRSAPLRGQALGVAPDGALRLLTAEGEQLIHTGEISLRGVPA